jgi:hypothetical protein
MRVKGDTLEVEFQEKSGVWDLMLELTITSTYLIDDFEV